MASSFRRAFYTKCSKGVFGSQSYIQDGAFVKNVNGFKYFYKKAKCLTVVQICRLPRKSAKMQLLNKLSEILHKFVSLVFFQNSCFKGYF